MDGWIKGQQHDLLYWFESLWKQAQLFLTLLPSKWKKS